MATLEMILEQEVDINGCDNNGNTSILNAAMNGRESVVERLLECKTIDVNKAERWKLLLTKLGLL